MKELKNWKGAEELERIEELEGVEELAGVNCLKLILIEW